MALFSETIALLIKADTGGAVGPLKRLEGQAAQTATAWDRAGKKIGVSGATLKAGLAGITAGSAAQAYESMVRGVLSMADGFAEAVKAAGDLAVSVGSTIEVVSGMQVALVDAGVSADKSAAMLTKFATAAGSTKGAAALRALNVEMVRGQSGAVDYAATMVETVDAIMAVGDAAQRNAAFVALFGRQGATAFQDLLASGASLTEAMDAVAGRGFTAEDKRRADEYDAAMDSIDASMKDLGNTVGRTFLPAITESAQGLGVLADAAASLPGDVSSLVGLFATWTVPLQLIGKLAGDDAEAVKGLGDAAGDTSTSMQALTTAIADGVTSGRQFADAVADAGDELAAQDANARLAAQALDVYRASTDQAYESTLKLLGLDRSERSAQRAAEGAADSAGDAKANMDQALADAKAAKVVVENIAAIRGRERKKEESEGIIAGSTDVRAIEGIKGRKAQRKTRVIEAEGVITPAEARQIREATRQYEQSLDDIAAAWIRLAEARVQHKEALGLTLTEAEKLDEVRRALQEGLNVPGLTPAAKAGIKADLKVVEDQIKSLGGVPIEIDGIKFKEGTTKAQLTNLQNQIRDAGQRGNTAIVDDLTAKLADLKVSGTPADLNVALGLDPASVAASQAALANLGNDPKTGQPYTAKTVATVDTAKAKTDLDELTKAREMTVTVNYVPGAAVGLEGTGGATSPGARLNFNAGQSVSFNPTVINNYPKPERASDSIASSLRVAKYVVGLS